MHDLMVGQVLVDQAEMMLGRSGGADDLVAFLAFVLGDSEAVTKYWRGVLIPTVCVCLTRVAGGADVWCREGLAWLDVFCFLVVFLLFARGRCRGFT